MEGRFDPAMIAQMTSNPMVQMLLQNPAMMV
jgi:hypothetical protein